jgi:hypothetical protein
MNGFVGKKAKTLTWFKSAIVSAGTKPGVEEDEEDDDAGIRDRFREERTTACGVSPAWTIVTERSNVVLHRGDRR